MKTLYEAFATNKDYEQKGVILGFGVAKFKVRRAGGSNRRYFSALMNALQPHRRAMDAGLLSQEKQAEILMDVYFAEVVVGWEDVTDEAGNVLDFTLENFKRVMADLPDLWVTLRNEADNVRNFQNAEAKLDGETLGKS